MKEELTIDFLMEMLAFIHPMDQALCTDLRSKLEINKYKKGEFLLRAGSISDRIHFITKGLVHCYCTIKNKPDTDYFMAEGEIAISKESFYTQTPGTQFIEAMEDTVTISISFSDLENIYQTHLTFNINGRKLTEIYHQRSNFKSMILRLKYPEDRYKLMKQYRSDLVERVPGKYLSSFLGMREETLSRLRSGEKDGNSGKKK